MTQPEMSVWIVEALHEGQWAPVAQSCFIQELRAAERMLQIEKQKGWEYRISEYKRVSQ